MENRFDITLKKCNERITFLEISKLKLKEEERRLRTKHPTYEIETKPYKETEFDRRFGI